MKAKTGYIKYDEEYKTWEFKKTLDGWDHGQWIKIVYFELEDE
jgi:hypothetical protein